MKVQLFSGLCKGRVVLVLSSQRSKAKQKPYTKLSRTCALCAPTMVELVVSGMNLDLAVKTVKVEVDLTGVDRRGQVSSKVSASSPRTRKVLRSILLKVQGLPRHGKKKA